MLYLLLCKHLSSTDRDLHETRAGDVELLMIAHQRLRVDQRNISKNKYRDQ